jgi:branched-subunit amino acid ABC-type transport system permease component
MSSQVLAAQLLLGVDNGSLHEMMGYQLAIAFGLLGVIHCAYGALYMRGGSV